MTNSHLCISKADILTPLQLTRRRRSKKVTIIEECSSMWRRRRWARSRGPGRGAGGPPAGRRRVPDHVDLLLFLLRRLRPLRPRIGLKLLRHETARHRANWSSTGWAASSSATQSFVARLLHFQLRSPVGILVG